MSVIIAGDRSGAGKTTVTLALLSGLAKRGIVQSFKVGPDYIDPMFHRAVTGRPCRNLDPILTSPSYVQSCFDRHIQEVDYAVVEGVMGLFDGVTIPNPSHETESKFPELIPDFASTAHIARLLDLPVLLVLDCRSLSGSIAAIAHGFATFDPRVKIAGLILNKVGSDRHLELLTTALEPLGIPVMGILRRTASIEIPDRHLGLVPTAELDNLSALFAQLRDLAEECFDWEKLLPLLKSNNPSSTPLLQESWGGSAPDIKPAKIRIAVAYDRAFSFYYQDNLDLLESLGAELLYWSPLKDDKLPPGVQGLYFGGGFPEVFGAELASNQQIRDAVKQAIWGGMPTYAECGGLMYLTQGIKDFQGQLWEMVGILPTEAVMGDRLALGYRQATALQDGLVVKQGQQVWGHEFHRSALTPLPDLSLFPTQGFSLWHTQSLGQVQNQEGWHLPHLHASYVHLHWGNTPEIPQQFLLKAKDYRSDRLKIQLQKSPGEILSKPAVLRLV